MDPSSLLLNSESLPEVGLELLWSRLLLLTNIHAQTGTRVQLLLLELLLLLLLDELLLCSSWSLLPALHRLTRCTEHDAEHELLEDLSQAHRVLNGAPEQNDGERAHLLDAQDRARGPESEDLASNGRAPTTAF